MRNHTHIHDALNQAAFFEIKDRKRWMGILARASFEDMERFWSPYKDHTTYEILRQPEYGLTMVRGRAGGTGQQFNLGEMSITRCSIKLEGGLVGHAYIAGRNRKHAEFAAVFDALLQSPAHHDAIQSEILSPLANTHLEKLELRSKKASSTKVDFYTMVRGEDE